MRVKEVLFFIKLTEIIIKMYVKILLIIRNHFQTFRLDRNTIFAYAK